MTSNYEKAVEIYEAKGQSAVFDAVLDGTLTATSWHWCAPCECDSPHEGNTCLVCGWENELPKYASERLITVNFEELFRHAEGYMMSENDLCWALGMALINNYHHHPIVYQLENEALTRAKEKAAKRKEKV